MFDTIVHEEDLNREVHNSFNDNNNELEYTSTIAKETAKLYNKIKRVVNPIDWESYAPYISEINRLKKEKGAVILAHNYITPEIFHCVADITGDSLQLAQQAAEIDSKIIVQAGVHFMAETSKILSPEKTILIPDLKAGCSLAASITAKDVRLLREKYPDVPIVTYVNTSAEVKAESDICCTSSNALAVVESLDSDTVLMIPDQYLASNIAKQTKKKILTWQGACEVHEQFTPDDVRKFRKKWSEVVVLAHPECPPDIVAESDLTGSTGAMNDYVRDKQPKKVLLVTECSMSDNLSVDNPDVEFARLCNSCPYMKRISLQNILTCLQTMTHKVTVDPSIAARARLAVERMLAVKNK